MKDYCPLHSYTLYVGKTGRTLKIRLLEHRRNCQNGEVQRLSVEQHTIEDYRID